MKTLLVALSLLLSTSAFAVQINGVTGLTTNGGAGTSGLQIYKYYGLWSGDITLEINLLLPYLHVENGLVDGSYIAPALESYATDKGSSFAATMLAFFQFSFTDYMAEIDAGRPVSITTDTSPDWFQPIEVTGVGYDIINGVESWGYVSTWSGLDDVIWLPWIEADITHAWGISSVITLSQNVSAAPVPEPSTILLLAIGMILIVPLRFWLAKKTA